MVGWSVAKSTGMHDEAYYRESITLAIGFLMEGACRIPDHACADKAVFDRMEATLIAMWWVLKAIGKNPSKQIHDCVIGIERDMRSNKISRADASKIVALGMKHVFDALEKQ